MKVRKGSILDYFRRVHQTLPKMMRLGAFLVVLFFALGALQVRGAFAQLEDSLLDLGEQYTRMGVSMFHYEGSEHQSTPATMLLNGQPIHIATGHTSDSLETVLDVFEERCIARDGRIKGRLDELLAEDAEGLEYDSSLLDPTLRKQDDEHGFVACLDLRDDVVGPGEVLARFTRFRRTMDVSELGDFRYVYAQAQPDGQTTFTQVWVDGEFNIGHMFPARGDAPGGDLPEVPRPAESRRIFSSMELGKDQRVVVYTNDQSKDQVHEFYLREMAALGWGFVDLTPEEANQLPFEMPPTSGDLLVFERGPRLIAVAAMDNLTDGQLTHTIMLEL